MRNLIKRQRESYFLLLVIIVLLLPFTVFLVREGAKYFIGAAGSTPTLSFSPSVLTLPTNNTIKLLLDSKEKKTSFVSLELHFDNQKVRLVDDIIPSQKLRTIILRTTKDDANRTGTIRLALGLHVDNVSNPPSGVFEIAQLRFEPLVDDPTSNLSISDSNLQVINSSSIPFNVEIAEALITGPNTPSKTTPPSDTSNMFVNPSFENSLDNNYSTHGSASYTQATDQAHTGNKSLKIVSSQSSSSALTRWFSKNGLLPAEAGKTYEASMWLKTKDVVSRAVLVLNFWGPGAFDDLSGGATSSSVTGTKDWQKVTVRATAPGQAKYARIEMRLYGKGIVWFDDGSYISK